MIDVLDSPAHIRIHTLRKAKVSKGEVSLTVAGRIIDVEPHTVYPISGEDGFEALDYYLPFWSVFGKDKPVYDEDRIRESIEHEQSKRLDVTPKPKALPSESGELPAKLTGVELAILGASGYHVICRSAHRTEGPTYEERIFNFTIHCPVTGGGMIRIADCPVDIHNQTFDPHAPVPHKHRDLVLLDAFNRTHKPRTSDIEDRKRRRIAEAEANMRKHEAAERPQLESGESSDRKKLLT